ncbi:MAG: DSD1 family PLP-dependent enzyme [bacterium]|nr:DSD1 family PLP-dependent enzyme [bacterium]
MSALPAPGLPVREIDTPALLVDLDAMERNLARMAERLEGTSLRLRPHAKTHKSPLLALEQMARGAVGICCQKLGEAEVMAEGGVPDILVSSEIATPAKLRRLADLTRNASLMAVVDHPRGAEMLSDAMRAAGSEIGVLVDVDVGHGRCGTLPGAPAAALARTVDSLRGLRLRGIQAYQGQAQHVEGFEARRRVYGEAIARIQETITAFDAAGLPCEIRSGGGTGSYRWDIEAGVFNELQAGSYLFMDAHYCSVGGAAGPLYEDFEPSLYVLSTVVSIPAADRAVVDAGHKSLSTDSGPPVCLEIEDAPYRPGGDEHGILDLAAAARRPELGQPLLFQPSHCDTTINLYDVYHGIRGGMEAGVLERLIPIAARGKVQ